MKRTFNGYQRVVFRVLFPDSIPASKPLPENSGLALRGKKMVVAQKYCSADISEEALTKMGEEVRGKVSSLFGTNGAELKVYFKKGIASPEYDFLLSATEQAMASDLQTLWVKGHRLRPYSDSKKYGVLVTYTSDESGKMHQIFEDVRKDVIENYGLMDDALKIEPFKKAGQQELCWLISDKADEKPILSLGDTVWCVSKVENQKTKELKSYVAEKTVCVMELLPDGTIEYTAGKKKELVFRREPDGTLMATGFRKPVYTDKTTAEERAAKGVY